ncbi:MAG: hypothetical protein IPL79_01355 [Myxococcales bacterium]|nr:hypothetical protein [Myxococcales bacterium]
MKQLFIACVVVVAVATMGHRDALAQPAAEVPAAVPTEAPPPAAAAPPTVSKEACLAFIDADPALSAELTAKLRAHIDDQFWRDQEAATKKRHNDDATLIAINKRHVVMAYAAMWLLAVGFLAFLWHRQRGLVARLGELEARLSHK